MKTKEKNESVRITTLGIATALIGSMVGPGFSSGNELMQFFGNFGYIGVAGVLVCETLVAVTVWRCVWRRKWIHLILIKWFLQWEMVSLVNFSAFSPWLSHLDL